MRARISLAALVGAIVASGIGLAALRSPSQLWSNVFFSIAVASLVLAAIHIGFDRGGARAFAAGWLIAGGTYFAFWSMPGLRDVLGPRLVTEPAIDMLYVSVAPPETPNTSWTNALTMWQTYNHITYERSSTWERSTGTATDAPRGAARRRWAEWTEPDRTPSSGKSIGTVALASPQAFRDIGHALATLLVGAAGAFYARHLAARQSSA